MSGIEQSEQIVTVEEREEEDVLKLDEEALDKKIESEEIYGVGFDLWKEITDSIEEVNNQLDGLLDISWVDGGEIDIDELSNDEYEAINAIAKEFNQKINNFLSNYSGEKINEKMFSEITSNEELKKILKNWEESSQEALLGSGTAQDSLNKLKKHREKLKKAANL